MIALDTNVLSRLLTKDDPKQAQAAVALIDGGDAFFVPLTVTLELEWVLRGVYKLASAKVVESLNGLLGIRNLHFEQESAVLAAIRLYAAGFDFADALHHAAAASGCDALISFDEKFSSRAERRGLQPPVKLLQS